jgi:N-acylglucosamine-6-phosphate 2-epimerase
MKPYQFPKLIVSCQFRPDDILNNPSFIKAIIQSVLIDKDNIVRTHADYTHYIQKLGGKSIALVKSTGKTRWINSTVEMLEKSIKYKPYAVAIESTHLLHKNPTLLSKLYKLVKDKSPNTLIVADIGTLRDAIRAEQLGADIVATTLARIPERSGICKNHKEHCKLIKELSKHVSIPIIAEGIIRSPEEAKEFLDSGATSVIIGHHIIHPGYISRHFNSVINYEK